ncbi:MutS-related protein [Maribacter arenosus]|nr:DNA mismatch repair protein MutS [Maribacter arenosus]
MIQNPQLFYKEQIASFEGQLARVKNQLHASSMIRLVVFCLMAFGVYLTFGNIKLVIGLISITIVIFIYLVSRHTDLQYKFDKIQAILQINTTELEVLQRKFNHLPMGNEFEVDGHYFSQDIDLFGRGSFYQYANRTDLKHGSEVLASMLLENSIENIPLKQEAIKELSKMPRWRQNFSAIASLVKTKTPYHVINNWIKTYQAFVPKYMRFFPIVFSLVSILIVTLYFTDNLNGWGVVLWLFLGLGITRIFSNKINILAENTSKAQSTFQQYQLLILELEKIEFNASLLIEQQSAILLDSLRASKVLEEFSKILNALDQRNNMLVGFLGNAFLLWDIHQCYKIERWLQIHGNKIEEWFNVIAFFDAYNSLGNFAFNHPGYAFPKIVNGEVILKSDNAGHPLLDPEISILNDFKIAAEQFFIITGANMAGKSTFLRTVSLQIMMANVGLPVCASSVEYSPIKLITSMRTVDSLADDESYFFSELKRLKFIVDEIKKDHYFIVLDEILKGTNSTDKAIGSRKFIERLVASKSTGIIATHDLSLCKAADDLPQVHNYYFDAEIINDELHFDYTFKKGVCQNMNASFLLKKMHIVD